MAADSIKTFLKEAWDIRVERARTNKALRVLAEQNWSVEFLTAMCVRAAKLYGQGLEMTIQGPNNFSFTVKPGAVTPEKLKDDDIFMHLDDENKINQFINQINRGK